MKLSKEANESLELIRAKVNRKDIDFSNQELLYLDEVYGEITKLSTGKAHIISRGCSSCINNAVNIVYNFVTYHEERHEQAVKSTPKITTKMTSDLTVKELQDICRERGIKFHHKAKEAKLIELINGKE